MHHSFVGMKETSDGMLLPSSSSSDEGERIGESGTCGGDFVRPVENVSSTG